MSRAEQEHVRSHKKNNPANNLNPEFEKMRLKDREMVRGKFIFHEVPGGSLGFVFKKWDGDPVERFDLVDGEIYTLPLGVAKHLNKECKYPIHSFSKDEEGVTTNKIGQWVRRCSFQSLEFVDTADLTPEGDTARKE